MFSQYNALELCWRVLENHWNGTLLTSIPTGQEWAKGIAWRGVSPSVHFWDRTYQTGERIA